MKSLEALDTIIDFLKEGGGPQPFEEEAEMLIEDLEILEILRKHLYVAPELVELKMTGQEYANIHKVKYHNGIPIVVDLETFNKINKWFNKRGERK